MIRGCARPTRCAASSTHATGGHISWRPLCCVQRSARLCTRFTALPAGSTTLSTNLQPGATIAQLDATLGQIEDVLLAGLNSGTSRDPLMSAVIDTATRYELPSVLFRRFITSMRMDLTVVDYPSREALQRYIHGSAEVIGLQVLPVLGTTCRSEEAAPYAAALGSAFQLTNFLRDLAEDLARGRVYLPADELAAFGVDRELLIWCAHRSVTEPRVRAALADQIARTRSVYQRAALGGAHAPPGVSLVCGHRADPLRRHPRAHRGRRLQRFRSPGPGPHPPPSNGRRGRVDPNLVGQVASRNAGTPVCPRGRLRKVDVNRVEYFLVLAACVVSTLPLEFAGACVYRRPAMLIASVLPPAVVFLCWDMVAVGAGVWNYNPTYVEPARLPGGIPIEELLFFIVIPVCAILSYETVGRCLRATHRPHHRGAVPPADQSRSRPVSGRARVRGPEAGR